MQGVAHHHDLLFAYCSGFADEIIGEYEHLRVGFAKADKFLAHYFFDHIGDSPYGDRYIVYRKRVSMVGIGYDNRDRSFAQDIYRFVKIVEPVKTFVVQKYKRV